MSLTTVEAPNVTTLAGVAGSYADAVHTFAQISPITFGEIGASHFLRDDASGLLQFSLPGVDYRKMFVRHVRQGEYMVEVGHLDASTRSWVVDACRIKVMVEELDTAVSALAR